MDRKPRKPPFKPKSQDAMRALFESDHTFSSPVSHDVGSPSCVASQEPLYSYEIILPATPMTNAPYTQEESHEYVSPTSTDESPEDMSLSLEFIPEPPALAPVTLNPFAPTWKPFRRSSLSPIPEVDESYIYDENTEGMLAFHDNPCDINDATLRTSGRVSHEKGTQTEAIDFETYTYASMERGWDSFSDASHDTVEDEHGMRRELMSGLAVEHGQNPLTYDVSQLFQFQEQFDQKPQLSPYGQNHFPNIQRPATDMMEYIPLVVVNLSAHEFNKSITIILNKVCTENFTRCIHDLTRILRSSQKAEYWLLVMKQCMDSAPHVSMYVNEYGMIIKELFDAFQDESQNTEESVENTRLQLLEHLQHLFESQKNLVIQMHPHAGEHPDTYKKEKDSLLGIVHLISSLYQNGFLTSKNLLFYGILYRLMRPPHGHDIDMECVLKLLQQCGGLFDFSRVKQELKASVKRNSFRIQFLVKELQ